MDYNDNLSEVVQERIKNIRSTNDFTSHLIRLLETECSVNIESILNEYRYATDLLLNLIENPGEVKQLKEVEAHVQKAYKMAMNKHFEFCYDRFENYYTRLLRISRYTRRARKALLKMRAEMDAARIHERVAAIGEINNFDEYTKIAESIQKDLIEISRLMEIALVECEDFVKHQRIRTIFRILAIVIGAIIGIVSTSLIGW